MRRHFLFVVLGISLACHVHAEEVFYDISLNGKMTSNAQMFDKTDDVLWAEPEVWTRAGIILSDDEKAKEKLSSSELGITFTVEEDIQRVSFKAPENRVPRQTLNGIDRERPKVSPTAKGVLLGFDTAFATSGKSVSGSLGHSVIAHAGKDIILTHTGQLNQVDGKPEYRRGFTVFTHDDPNKLRSIALGDTQSRPATSLVSPVLMGGLTVAKDPTLDPSQPLFHVPTLGGVATDPSTVQAIINGSTSQEYEVLAGGFDYRNPGLANGYNDATFVIRDKFGRETRISESLYFSSNTLRKGLWSGAVSVGKVRQGTSDKYGELALSMHGSKGLTNSLTVHGGLEGTKDNQAAYIGATTFGAWGELQASFGQSKSDKGTGQAYSAQYTYNRRSWGLGVQATEQNAAWWDLSQIAIDKGATRTQSAFFNARLNNHLTLQARATRAEQDGNTTKREEVRLDWGARDQGLSLSFGRTQNDKIVGLTYRRNFGPVRASADYRQSNRGQYYAVNASGDIDTKLGEIDWRARATDYNGNRALELGARIDKPKYELTTRLDLQNTSKQLSGTFSSGIWIGEGVVQQVKPRGQSLAVVKVAGVEGVPVSLENKPQGKTNKKGAIVLGPVRPLEANKIKIDEKGLPFGVDIPDSTIYAAPNRGAVALVEFKPSAMEGRTYTLKTDKTIEAGASIKNSDAVVGHDNEVYMDTFEAGRAYEVEGVCTFKLPEKLPKFEDTVYLECK